MKTNTQHTRANQGAAGSVGSTGGSAISDPPKPLTPEEILTLKVAELTLHRDVVDTAARVLLRGVRPASRAQDLVLRADLEELKRRCDDAAKVKWPTLPNNKTEQ